MSRWFYDDESERFMARRPSRDPEGDARRLRQLLATLPEVYDVSRMSDHEVLRQVGRYRAEGKLPAEDQRQHAPEPARPNVQPTAVVPVVVAATTAARAPVTEEKRYTLLAAFNYKPTPTVCAHLGVTARFRWENEATGPETRRSGAIPPGAAAFTYVRRSEMRPGNYRLELKNDKKLQDATLDARTLKTKRS